MAGRRRSDRALRSKLRSPGRPPVAQADAPSAFLGIDRGRPIERGRGDWCGRVSAGRSEMVSGGRRHATIDACTIIEVAVRSISVVCRAGGACNPACPGFGGCGRSLATWGDRDRRSHASCAATLRHAAAIWIIGPALRSGMLNGPLGVRRLPSWRSTWRAADLCAGSAGRNGRGTWRCCRSWADGILERSPTRTSKGSTNGRRRGARSRLPIAYGSTFRMMRRCASAMRQSTNRFMCKAAALCVVS